MANGPRLRRRTRASAALALLAALGGLFTAAPAEAALGYEREKTDVITLTNGDRYTGEILNMQFGILQLKTSHAGTVLIEWPTVRSLDSQYMFRVETLHGAHYWGYVHTQESELVISGGDAEKTLRLSEVSTIVPYESSFWRRIDGSVSVGYSYTKSSGVTQGSVGFSANYSGEDVEAQLNASALLTRTPSEGTTNQDSVGTQVYFLRPTRNFWGFLGGFQRDPDLGIDARIVAGSVVGRHVLQTQQSQVDLIVGLDFNQEWATKTGASDQSLEGVLGAQWRVYKFSYPKVNLDVNALVYPSITESPRIRSTLNITLTFKLTSRFALQLSEYGNYDSRPPEEGASNLDYGIVASLAYNFGSVVP
jgi:hypothetical protein